MRPTLQVAVKHDGNPYEVISPSLSRSSSNYDLAYKIHSLQPVSNGQNSHKNLLTELKLKFL